MGGKLLPLGVERPRWPAETGSDRREDIYDIVHGVEKSEEERCQPGHRYAVSRCFLDGAGSGRGIKLSKANPGVLVRRVYVDSLPTRLRRGTTHVATNIRSKISLDGISVSVLYNEVQLGMIRITTA